MTARWQRVGCLLVILYASVTSLMAVPSGETTGYVRVIIAILRRYGSCRLAILDDNDCPGVKKCGQQQVHPNVPYGSGFTATRIVKGSSLVPDVPTLSFALPWERCNRAGDCPL